MVIAVDDQSHAYVTPPSRCPINERALGFVYRRAYCTIQPPTHSTTTWQAVKSNLTHHAGTVPFNSAKYSE